MELLLENLSRHISLTASEQTIFLDHVTVETYKAKTELLRPGQVDAVSYFILSGLMRNYATDEAGTEHTLSFASPGWWMADMYSFLSRQPGQVYIETLEPTTAALLTKNNQERLYKLLPQTERFFRIIVENSLVAHQQRLIDNLSLTAEARYDKFAKKYPELTECLSQKNIASYIGVTPEFFSKMKAAMLRR